ncbi:MAG: tetratricopeptide repeat protein, partial [Bacteroidia bacterium]|nr:tetratricopeptide repeat protein [Bacteroidia bacterium]
KIKMHYNPYFDAINAKGSAYRIKGNNNEALVLFKNALNKIGDNKLLLKRKCSLTNNLANVYNAQKNYPLAVLSYKEVIKTAEELGELKYKYVAVSNLIGVYQLMGNNEKALFYANEGFKLTKLLDDKRSAPYLYSNVGLILMGQDRYDDALENIKKALAIFSEYNLKPNMAEALNNMGIIYRRKGELDKSLEMYRTAHQIYLELNDSISSAAILENISIIYQDKKNFDLSNNYALSSKKIAETYNDTISIIKCNNILIENYIYLNQTSSAINLLNESESVIRKFAMNDDMLIGFLGTKKIVKIKLGDFKAAMELTDQMRILEKKISNSEYNNNISLFKTELDLFSKEKEIEQLNIKNELAEKENEKKQAQLEVKRNQQVGLLIIILLVIVFAYLMYNRFKLTQAQKIIIEKQKTEVEIKNKEILDSINYAKRIQTAILPPEKSIKHYLKSSFIFYKPKDIVAGDFYWMENKSGQVLFAAADCTGHGVPGALVSVVCNNGLNRSVREYGLTVPGEILDKTREIVIQEFEKSDEVVKDGMDISLCALSIPDLKLNWAGANNPLWIIKSNGTELIEIKADKQPIGKYADQKPFTTHSIDLEKGDTIYIFTDGYQDQFGGEKGKKFKASKLKETLLSIQNLNMDEQKEFIVKVFEDWKGRVEQVDDVCIIGVKL